MHASMSKSDLCAVFIHVLGDICFAKYFKLNTQTPLRHFLAHSLFTNAFS